jgi:homoserine O-succinyltransferase
VPVRLTRPAAARPGQPSHAAGPPPRWTCAFVNNMPDGAFEATERQFLGLLDAASGAEVVEVSRHALAGVPRGERTASRIAEEYLPVGAIRQRPPDLLIVTGSNPLEEKIDDEPYWGDLVDLLGWGTEHVQSMLLSCLSAHAGLTHFDGLERVRLASKCTGVFTQRVDGAHPLAAGLEAEVTLPHSRTSTVPGDLLEAAGYRIAIQSESVGWTVASKMVGRAEVVLVQGHPEYDPTSLLREYHRDARRYVQREREELPVLPFHCVAPADWGVLQELHCSITGSGRDPATLEAYPFDAVGDRAEWPWHPVAERLYANWLAGVPKRSN